eukprot:PRCOL_00004463-RA
MVFYFVPRGGEVKTGERAGESLDGADFLCYMGADKFENEELIRWGWPEDVWFHVDKLSSAHVYLRLPKGVGIADIPVETLEDCAQLVKYNSIQGNKDNNVDVVYTPWENLKKTQSMEVGQIGFHTGKAVLKTSVQKRDNAIVNRLNKTKQESKPDLEAERMRRDKREKDARRAADKLRRKEEDAERVERRKQKDLREYKGAFDFEEMKSNADIMAEAKASGKTYQDLEDDFM